MKINGTFQLKKKDVWISLLLGVYASVGACLSLTREVTKLNSPNIDMDNEFMVFVRTLYRSVSGNRLQTFLMAVMMGILVYAALQIRQSGKERVLTFFYALLFAGGQMIAMSYKRIGSWDLLVGTDLQKLRTGIKGSAYLLIAYVTVVVLCEVVRRFLVQEEEEGRKFSWIRFLGMAALMFAAWLPYLIYFYPGTSNEDTVIQMMQYFEIPSYIQKMSPVQGEGIFLTNHHPVLLTMLFAQFFECGLYFGDIRIGIALYSVLHMAFLSLVFSGCLQYMRWLGVTRRRVCGMQILFMFFPIFPLYGICMVKDTIYSAFCLIYILLMYHIARTDGEALGRIGFDAALFATGLLMMLTKVFALHILLIVGVVYLFRYRRYIGRILITIALPAFLYKAVYLSLLLPALGVAPGGIQEALSVPFQQTARYVLEYGDEVTAEEKEAIGRVLPYDKLAKLYHPELSDPVKKRYKQNATKRDLQRYFKAWFQMFRKHPEVYAESLLNNTYQYYDINKVSDLEYYQWNDYLIRHDKEEQYTRLYVLPDEQYEEQRYLIHQIVLLLQKIPILNVFASIGLIPWILLFFALYNIRWKKRREFSLLLIPLLTLAVCMVSPDNGNSRYIMPILYAFPFLFALELLPEKGRR